MPETAAADAGAPFELVLVCTGNQIRSPIAEALVGRLAGSLPVSARSRGVLELASKAPPREAVDAAAELGLDISGHRSRRLEPQSLRVSDAVVGFEPVHVATAVLEGGAAAERSFLLRELVELLEQVHVSGEPEPAERARQAVAQANERRRELGARNVAASLADPLGRGRNAYRTAVGELGELVPRLLDGLFRPEPAGDRAR